MNDSYYTAGYDRTKPKRRSILMWLLDGAMTLLTLVAGICMVLTYLAPHINPARAWFFPVLGLIAPALYVLAVILALYWIIRWRLRRAAFMGVIVAVGIFQVSLFWRPEVRRNHDTGQNRRGTFKVMSYNVRLFYGEDKMSSVDSVVALIERENPDIVCLQEFNRALTRDNELFTTLEERYKTAQFGLQRHPDCLEKVSMAILSKFRMLRSGVAYTPSTSVWADLLIGDDTVRILNNHLQSTSINASDNAYITQRQFISDTARETKIRSIVERFRDNSVLRAGQVDSIARFLETSPRRRIVCGDFNDTPMSYVYRTMAHGLQDAFSECGSGYSHTFRGFFNTLRIDYVLLSHDFEALSYKVDTVEFSDHYPVFVQLKKSTL